VNINVVTLFPDFFRSPLKSSILARAITRDLVKIETHDPRDFASGKQKSVDDEPYGGGGGMVFKPEPFFQMWDALNFKGSQCVYLTADGQKLDHQLCIEFSQESDLVLLCGHYKGIDERIRENLIDREVSVGDFVLTGGEPAAIVMIDAVVRLLPGVLGNFCSALEDSFQEGLLDCPWYTRPKEYRGVKVPEVLQNGDHRQTEKWRRLESLKKTFLRRPDLLEKVELGPEELKLISQWKREGLVQNPSRLNKGT